MGFWLRNTPLVKFIGNPISDGIVFKKQLTLLHLALCVRGLKVSRHSGLTWWLSGLFFKAITVGSSSGINFKLLHDWSNFVIPKLMPVEHISLMPSSYLSPTNTRQDTRQYVIHHGSAKQEFADASVRSNEQKGVLIAGVPYPLSPTPPPFFPSSLSPTLFDACYYAG